MSWMKTIPSLFNNKASLDRLGVNSNSKLTIDGVEQNGGTGSYALPIASSTALGGVKVGSGLTISSGGVLSSSATSGSGGLLFKGLLSDFVSLTDNYAGYFNSTLEDGIYLVLKSNRPSDKNPPIHSEEDFYLIHQKMPKDGFNWAYQEAFATNRPQIRYRRRALQGSSKTDGRQQDWEYIGADEATTRSSKLKILTLGDSITAKWAGDPVDATTYPQSMIPFQPHMNTNYLGQDMYRVGYQSEFHKRLRSDVWTIGRGGSKMAKVNDNAYDPYSFSMVTRPVGVTLKADTGGVDLTKYDIITVAFGTNDVGWLLPIGTINSENTSEFMGAMNVGLRQIYAQNPKALIFFITPPPRMDIGKADTSISLEQRWTNCREQTKPYEEAIEAMCDKWGLPVFNSYKKSGINFYNYTTYMNPDLIHYDNYSLWGGRIAEWLKQYI